MKAFNFIGILISLVVFPIFAQAATEPSNPQDVVKDIDKMRQDAQKTREERQKKFESELREKSPEAYKEYMQQKAKQDKIDSIVESYRSGKLTEGSARSQLKPLIKNEAGSGYNEESINTRIKMLEQQISHLKKIKANPDLLIEERIDSYLGVPRKPSE